LAVLIVWVLYFEPVKQLNVHSIKNVVVLVVASKKIGLEVNAKKTQSMVMFRDQDAGQNLNIKIDNKSCERVEEFKYLGTTLIHAIVCLNDRSIGPSKASSQQGAI
jgi:hypothetical protein